MHTRTTTRTSLAITLSLVTGLVALSAACSSSSSSGGGLPADQQTTALRGTLKSVSGQPLAGVAVSAGSVTATTAADGRFELRAPAGKAMVRFTKDGYVDTVRAVSLVDGRPTQLDVALLALAPAIPLDATAGGTAKAARSATLVAPAGAFVDASGKAVTGSVDVHLTPLDPGVGAERAAAPGFEATSGGTSGMLESFGMMDVTVKQAGKKLQVATGKELELRIPAPASQTTPTPSMPLWSFDESKGIWVEEGTATYDAATKTYVGRAKHMSMWNADKVYLATCVCGVVKEKNGAALPGARIEGEGISYLGSSSTNAGNDGKFCLAVRKDSDVDVAAYHKSGGGQSRRIKSGSADTKVPAELGDARCLDIGVWEVERDVFTGSNGEKVSCGNVSNPFAGGCAQEFGEAFGNCFKTEGACVTKSEVGKTTTSYANGAKIESSASDSKYYSASGQLCSTATIDTGSSPTDDKVTIKYTLPSGKVFTLTTDNSDMVITCPDGTETRVTPQQRQALEACGGGGGGDSESGCTYEGPSADAGGVPTECTSDATCNGNVCCTIPDSPTKYCLPAATCNAIPKP